MQKPSFSFFFGAGPFAALILSTALSASAQHEIGSSPTGYSPRVASASAEGERSLQRIRVPAGLKLDLVAAEPHLANPVAFAFDEKGRIFVAETFRINAGANDIRGLMPWLDDELASKSVGDRYEYTMRRLGSGAQRWMAQSDRIKLLEDRDGDGVVDHSSVFAENFNSLTDGIGAGLLVRKGDVYYTCIPNLWLLRDANRNGIADYRQSLQYGFGVRLGFYGHDLHGLKLGPDGKIYFSIGDRGTSVHVGQGRRVGSPECGDVFRCNLDGSEFEVFASGLRNPQELAFDKFGNLFTGDNNSDGGDRARWIHVVEGGDSGWRVGYQHINNPYQRGPYNAEKLWYPPFEGQAAYLLPAATNITAGPSGLAYYPGTGLPDRYKDKMFLVDFRGSQQSEIHTFDLVPDGATYAVAGLERFTTGYQPTDVDFGVEGGVYTIDWVEGWGMTGKGRVYRYHDPEVDKSQIVQETKRLIGEGMEKRSLAQLGRLLGHQDMRVRQEAQFELAARGLNAVRTLSGVAARNQNQLARLHAIWGLGQIATNFKNIAPRTPGWAAIEPLLRLTTDGDPEVRANAAKTLADHRVADAFQPLLILVQDESPRVRMHAAMALGKLGRPDAIPAILTMLRQNADQDRHLRHAGVMALTWIHDLDALLAAAKDPSPSVRMGVLLAMRRLERPEIVSFLSDSDPLLVTEAARAINDEPINGGMYQLAGLLRDPERITAMKEELREPIFRRAINANLRVGTNDTAQVLVQFALNDKMTDALRTEALSALSDWEMPSGRDRVVGLWRPVTSRRDPQMAANALNPSLAGLLKDSPGTVRTAAILAVERLKISGADAALAEIVAHTGAPNNTRLAALRALAALNSPRLGVAVEEASASNVTSLRNEATRLRAQVRPSDAAGLLEGVLSTGTESEKQNALITLAGLNGDRVDGLISRWLDRLIASDVPPALQLDLLDAAARRSTPALAEKIAKYEVGLPKTDPLAAYRVMLQGGDAEAGKKVFIENQAAACFKCHKFAGTGGEVGPDLAGIGGKQSREYILESIVFPNKTIAQGFDNVLLTTKNGTPHAGTLKSENDTELVLNSPEDGLVTVKKADIARRERGPSSMPEGITKLITRQEIRDLVEFLATSK